MLRALRILAFVALLIGAAASAVFTLRGGGPGTSVVLMVLFQGWVLLPFVGLALADGMSRDWPGTVRASLHVVMLVLAVASPLFLSGRVAMPAGTAHAFVYLAVPIAAWVLIAVAVALPAWLSRRRAR